MQVARSKLYTTTQMRPVVYTTSLLYTFLISSDRQHLSYDACLEVRGEIIRIVLCCIVY